MRCLGQKIGGIMKGLNSKNTHNYCQQTFLSPHAYSKSLTSDLLNIVTVTQPWFIIVGGENMLGTHC